MTRIYMIRHGKAAAGWDGDADPGLNELGQAQAEAVAEKVQALVASPVPIFSSPLKRCQQTAAPLAAWGVTPQIESGVGEIPPPLEDLTARTEWLRRVMAGTWEGLYSDAVSIESGVDFRGWNDNVVSTLNAQRARRSLSSRISSRSMPLIAPPPAQQMSSASHRKIARSPSSTPMAQACHWSRRAKRLKI